MRIPFDVSSEIFAGISERADGSMVWWNRLPVDATIRKNRDRYFREVGINPRRVVSGGLVHGIYVAVVGEKDAGKYLLNTDALVTDVRNLFLAVTAADCMPIFFYDPITKSVGMAHAGWRSLVGGIAENVIRELYYRYGAQPKNVYAVIGPHIHECHYEVGNEVANQFAEQNIERRDGHLFAKLADEAKARLRVLGVKGISVHPICTYENENLYSARRDKIDPLQGMVAYAGFR